MNNQAYFLYRNPNQVVSMTMIAITMTMITAAVGQSMIPPPPPLDEAAPGSLTQN